MKYFISFVIVLLGLFYGIYAAFPLPINILLVLLIVVIHVMWEYSVFPKDFTANFKMRSEKKSLNKSNLGFALVWSFLLVFNIYDKGFNTIYFYILILWWTMILIDMMMNFVYQKKKPITVFVNDDELILNRRWLQTRNLRFLISVEESTFTRELKLNFKGKSEVRIPINEYNREDFQEFLDILIEKSAHTISIPEKIFRST